MDEELRKHFRGLRILVTIALLISCLSIAFTYVLFKEVSVPLDRLRTKELASLESRLNLLVTSRLEGRVDVELQLAILNLKEVVDNSSGEVQVKALKALTETQALLDSIRRSRVPEKGK